MVLLVTNKGKESCRCNRIMQV